ncbi:hypothetical protein J437_LFUL012589 [Ladona fulva]|uniref:G-protein coupled receptors family 1 profile domain-containing protein n=1 Tax=Ladona fulva TaxID=123851 RepID=A0A8K0P702_LADFU|nr:hypothetical protein J437_LFUL012588 [Ladona fulva]KAG8233164.1 hypothetical protein J437_LFUL012589 [Ladona fulva]
MTFAGFAALCDKTYDVSPTQPSASSVVPVVELKCSPLIASSDWHFGYYYCTVNNFVANVTVAASVFTLTGISFDR